MTRTRPVAIIAISVAFSAPLLWVTGKQILTGSPDGNKVIMFRVSLPLVSWSTESTWCLWKEISDLIPERQGYVEIDHR